MSNLKENSKRLIVLNLASAAAYRLIDVSVLVWLNQYLLRRISPDEYSLYPLLMSVVMFIPILASTLTSGLGRYIVEAHARHDDHRITQIVSSMFPPLLLGGIAIVIVGIVLAWKVDTLFKVPPNCVWDARIMMILLVASTALRPAMTVFSIGLFVRQRFVSQNGIRVFKELVRLGLLLVLLVGVGPRVLWVVVSMFVAEILDVAIQTVVSMRLMPALRFKPRAIRWRLVWELLSFGGWNFIVFAAAQVRQSATILLLNQKGTAMDVTAFHLGSMAERQLAGWTTVISAPLYPVVTSLRATGAIDRLKGLFLRGSRLSLWAILAVVVPGAIYAKEVISLYVGNEFSDASVVMALTLGSCLAGHVSWLVWHYSQAGAQVRSLAWQTCVVNCAVLGAVVYAVSVLRLGATGTALAYCAVGTIGTVALTWPFGLRLAGISFATWARSSLLPGLMPALVGAIAWTILRIILAPSSWSMLGLCVFAGAACYGMVLLMWCLAPEDRVALAKVIQRIVPKVRR